MTEIERKALALVNEVAQDVRIAQEALGDV